MANGYKFKVGDKVAVKGKAISIVGTIVCCDVNDCTFEHQYDVDYYKADGKKWTMIGVPERAISLI